MLLQLSLLVYQKLKRKDLVSMHHHLYLNKGGVTSDWTPIEIGPTCDYGYTNWVWYIVSLFWTWKGSAWVAWNSLPELTDALPRLACAPTEMPEHSMQAIERFVILMYN